jgi:hypothetical protein
MCNGTSEYDLFAKLLPRLLKYSHQGETFMLKMHPNTRLEYWFFKVNHGSTAILVDWIARRQNQSLELRVSIHHNERHEVFFAETDEITLTATHTTGQIEDVSWDLRIDTRQKWIAPDIFPAKLLRLSDLMLVSAPLARFSGQIQIGSDKVKLNQAAGMMSHYWGRQLAPEWWWLSANQFEDGKGAIECSVFKSHVWGLPLKLPLAYLYWHDGNRGKLMMSPPSRTSVTGNPDRFEVRFQPLRGDPYFLRGAGRHYNDLGDHIINTLVGDLAIYHGETCLAMAKGTAGLERRQPN